MAIPSRQIGWSTKANLLWQISKQLERLTCVTAGGCGTTTTTTTATICNCREVIEVVEYPLNFYTCLGEYYECPTPVECRSPIGDCIDISQPYTGVTPSETITGTCNCNPALVNSTNAFVDCTALCIEACDEPFNYFDIWTTQECLDTFPTIGCAIWLNVEGTVAFPDGTYNNGNAICIVITDGIITNII